MTGLLIGIISVIITVLFGYHSIKVSKKQGVTRSILFIVVDGVPKGIVLAYKPLWFQAAKDYRSGNL